MSIGVKASPGTPPIVPLIPEIDLISVMIFLFGNLAKLKFYVCNYKLNITFAAD